MDAMEYVRLICATHRDWGTGHMSRVIGAIKSSPLRPVARKFITDVYIPCWNTVTSRYPVGTNIFEREWDALIVLDACRVDALRAVAPEYGFLTEVESIWSVGSYTAEWTMKTFTNDYLDAIKDTVFITENVWSYRILAERMHLEGGVPCPEEYRKIRRGWPAWDTVETADFLQFENILEFRNDDTKLHPECGHMPHIVLDRAVAAGRELDFDRLVVHQTLPHKPFVADAIAEDRPLRDSERDFVTALKNGNATRSDVYQSYLDNLRFGLDYVETLLRNLDAETVVITADHGEAFGEWNSFEHPYGWPLPSVKKVPWAETSAVDSGEVEPEFPPATNDPSDSQVEEALADLGYL